MLIRSQDKKKIFDMTGSNIGIGVNNNIYGCGNTFGYEDISTMLGKYPTEQRAIEVLDEICMNYISLNSTKGNTPYVKNGVFQMPEV